MWIGGRPALAAEPQLPSVCHLVCIDLIYSEIGLLILTCKALFQN